MKVHPQLATMDIRLNSQCYKIAVDIESLVVSLSLSIQRQYEGYLCSIRGTLSTDGKISALKVGFGTTGD